MGAAFVSMRTLLRYWRYSNGRNNKKLYSKSVQWR